MTVRELVAGDLPGLAPLLLHLGVSIDGEELARRHARLDVPGNRAWVCESDGELVGWLHAQERPSLTTDATVEITALVVAPAARRRGCGRALMQAAERWAKERGCVAVALRSGVDRDQAHRFYERLGYVVRSTAHKLVKRL